jgi:acetylornithine deacetylase/succinyl-diaminopimelate desuccinylase-like protein
MSHFGAALAQRVQGERIVADAMALVAIGREGESEGPRAELLASILDDKRIDVLVDPVLPDRPNVIARVRGEGVGPDLLLNGHLDAGYVEAARWRRDPLDPWIEDGRLYGGGVSDMLGGLAAMVETIRVIADAPPMRGDVVLLASMHHDSNGVGTKYALATDSDLPRYCINGEPTNLTLVTMHGGCVKFKVTFTGTRAHVSRSDEGADAIDAALRFGAELPRRGLTYSAYPGLDHLPRFQIGTISGGSSPGEVADSAIVQGDVRTVPGMSWPTVRDDLHDIIVRTCPPGVTASLRCLVRQGPFVGRREGPLFSALIRAHDDICRSPLEVDVNPAAAAFVSDASDLARAGVETLVYGPGSWRVVADEFVLVDDLVTAARSYVSAAAHLMEQVE